ncbi:MAG: hypothetical protein ACFFE2_09370 [Candidatus Thorarchaeota archaeon]
MNTRKEFFDEPLVKVDFLKARFPKICPVCGASATTLVRLNIAKANKIPLRPSLDYLSPRRQWNKQHELKVLPIFVCENHSDPDSGTDRYQSLCLIIDGFLLAFVVFSLLMIGDRIARARPISLWSFLYFGLFGFAMLLTIIAFQPNVLEKAVRIIGFDSGMRNVLLAFKRPEYREQFLHENQMYAELVSWIKRADG